MAAPRRVIEIAIEATNLIELEAVARSRTEPACRVERGSWLNLVEGFFSKMARSVLRHIQVGSREELKARILAYLDDLNREPVIRTWTYKIDAAA
jgi:hypothetical protein